MLLPLAAVYVLWGMMKQLFLSIGSQANVFSQIVSTLMLGTAILWLMSHRLAQCKPATTFFRSLAILLAVGIISIYSFSGWNFSDEPMSILVMQAVWAVSLLMGLAITRQFHRRQFGAGRFAFMLLLLMIVVFDAAIFLTMPVLVAVQGLLVYNIAAIFMQVPLMGTVIAAIFYLFTLPYLILTFNCEFYRKRFLACLRLSEPVNRKEISLPSDT